MEREEEKLVMNKFLDKSPQVSFFKNRESS